MSKKYDLKLAQAYFNDYFINKWMTLVQFYFLLDKTNTLIVHNGDLVPLLYNVKKVSYLDINIDREEVRNRLFKVGREVSHIQLPLRQFYNATSYLTPILAYEYYLNPDSNLKRK